MSTTSNICCLALNVQIHFKILKSEILVHYVQSRTKTISPFVNNCFSYGSRALKWGGDADEDEDEEDEISEELLNALDEKRREVCNNDYEVKLRVFTR